MVNQKIHDCRKNSELPCLSHCAGDVLDELIEECTESAHNKALAENLQNIAESMAFKAWDKFGGLNFKSSILKKAK